jgi:hypothetical protein
LEREALEGAEFEVGHVVRVIFVWSVVEGIRSVVNGSGLNLEVVVITTGL